MAENIAMKPTAGLASVVDLGEMSGPVLLFGGPYSNLEATKALKALAEQRQLPPGNIICSGDVVAYCGDPEATVQLIRDWQVAVVMGNCEESLGFEADDCGCGFDPGSACDLLSSGWYGYASRRISSDSRAWMRQLPRRIEFQLGGRRVAVVHGGVERINQFVFPSTAASEKQRQLALLDAELVIGGHSGLPFGQRLGSRLWLNTGVIAMPANDGTADGWYLLLEPGDAGIQCHWQRLRYPAGQAQQRMRAQGLDNGYADALLSGVWPSQEVLPAAEKAQRGRALQPSPILF